MPPCQEPQDFQAGSISCLRVIHAAFPASQVSWEHTLSISPCIYPTFLISLACCYRRVFFAIPAIECCHGRRWGLLGLFVHWQPLRKSTHLLLSSPRISKHSRQVAFYHGSVCTHTTAKLWHSNLWCVSFDFLRHLWFIDSLALCKWKACCGLMGGGHLEHGMMDNLLSLIQQNGRLSNKTAYFVWCYDFDQPHFNTPG